MLTIAASQPGPHVVILGGVHGHEVCGIQALGYLCTAVPNLLTAGTVTFELGNPRAALAGVQQIDINLNRMFRDPGTMPNHEKLTYEFKRAEELKCLLAKCDVLLDLHSVSEKGAEPFIICEPKGYHLATALPASIVVSGFDQLHPLATDGFVNQNGGIGICLECGYHHDPRAFETAVKGSLSLLAALKMADPMYQLPPQKQQHLQATYIYKTKVAFSPVRDFPEFYPVKQGDMIGYDGDEPVQAPFDGFIMFPVHTTNAGAEAFVLAKEAT